MVTRDGAWVDLPFSQVAPHLGIQQVGRRYAPCPACRESRSKKDRRAPVMGVKGGIAWRCWACGEQGSAVNAVCWHLFGERLGKGDPRWREVIEWYADRNMAEPALRSASPLPPPPPPVTRQIDPSAILRRCTAPEDDPGALAWLRGRGYHLPVPAGLLPLGWSCDWWPWRDRFRLVVPAFDTRGALRSMHGRSLATGPDLDRKTTWPLGTGSRGLIMATRTARAMMRGEAVPDRLLIVEGLTDYLQLGQYDGEAVLGVGSGVDLSGLTIPKTTRVIIATDADIPGDRYAHHIAEQIAPHPARRIECPRT